MYKKVSSYVAQGQVTMSDLTGSRILMDPLKLPLDTNYFDIDRIEITLTPYSKVYFLAILGLRMDIIFDGKSLISYALNFSKTTDATFVMTSRKNIFNFKTPIFLSKDINLAYFNLTNEAQVGFIDIYGNLYEVGD